MQKVHLQDPSPETIWAVKNNCCLIPWGGICQPQQAILLWTNGLIQYKSALYAKPKKPEFVTIGH